MEGEIDNYGKSRSFSRTRFFRISGSSNRHKALEHCEASSLAKPPIPYMTFHELKANEPRVAQLCHN